MSALRLLNRCLNTGNKYSFLNYDKILVNQSVRNFSLTRRTFEKSSGKQNASSNDANPQAETTSRAWIGFAVLSGSLLVIYKTGLVDKYLPDSLKSKHIPPEIIETEIPVKVKPLLVHLPDTVPYLIVGGGTTAFSAFRSIRAMDPKAKVIVISDEEQYPYMRPPLSKELWFSEPELSKNLKFRQWNGRERSVFFEHEEFYCPLEELNKSETGGVSVVLDSRVVKLDPIEQKVYLDNGQIMGYEKCLLATGGTPKNLKLFEEASDDLKKRVFLYRNVKDFLSLEELSKKAKSITIIGGGFLGSELSCALGRRSIVNKSGLVINQIYPEIGNMAKVLPEYLSKWTTGRVKEEGVNVISGVEVEKASLEGHHIKLNLSNGSTLSTDYVIVAVGLNPNIDLAKSSGLEIDDQQGGFRVNAELEARTNLWVAGDAACFYDVKLGRRRVEHHDHAVVSGRLAGENMTGAKKPYWHQSMFWSDLGPNVGYEAIGLVDSSLPTIAVFAKQTDKDTPKAVVEASDENIRSETKDNAENKLEKENVKSSEVKKEESNLEIDPTKLRLPDEADQYSKGVIFYLRDNIIVGILLWNVFNRMSIARRILNEMKSYDDLSEVAKLFHLHAPDDEDV